MLLQLLVGATTGKRHSDLRTHSASEFSSGYRCGLSSGCPTAANTMESADPAKLGVRSISDRLLWDKPRQWTDRTSVGQSNLLLDDFSLGVFSSLRWRIVFRSASTATSSTVGDCHSPGAVYLAQPHTNFERNHDHHSLNSQDACAKACVPASLRLASCHIRWLTTPGFGTGRESGCGSGKSHLATSERIGAFGIVEIFSVF